MVFAPRRPPRRRSVAGQSSTHGGIHMRIRGFSTLMVAGFIAAGCGGEVDDEFDDTEVIDTMTTVAPAPVPAPVPVDTMGMDTMVVVEDTVTP